jgi:hypothetical protein
MGRDSKWEYFKAIYWRYRQAPPALKQQILDEFCRVCGYHRKHAIRKLNGSPPPDKPKAAKPRARGCLYGPVVLRVLRAVWTAAGYPWSVRLKALLPLWMPWIKQRFSLSAALEQQLLRISPRQIDRRLAPHKRTLRTRCYGRTKPGTLLKHQIPIRTDNWDVTQPGFVELDLVSHSGNCADGDFIYTLNLTDLYSGWVESRAVMGKGQLGVVAALDQIVAALPFALLGIDSDNGGEFINAHLKRYCDERHIQFTRGRPYKKDDNAHIEQKNWTHVRKLLGWERYDRRVALTALNQLYTHELRWMMNLFQPSVKLIRKVRVGSRLLRQYDRAQTPLDRWLAYPSAHTLKRQAWLKLRQPLDPFVLSASIDQQLQRIWSLANAHYSPTPANAKRHAHDAFSRESRNTSDKRRAS